ncbi:MAG: MAPEG family protein [Rhodobacterales bacterium]
MTTEITILTYAALLQVGQFVIYSIITRRQVPLEIAFGPRDTPYEVTGVAGRLKRALTNHYEALILFTIAVVVITLADQSTPTTRTCAWVYLIARVAYVPAYAFGLIPWRSLIWFIGLIATITMLLAALL